MAENCAADNYTVDGAEVRDGKLSDGTDAVKPRIFYLCDKKACPEGCNRHSEGRCEHTSDIRHARNFAFDGHAYREQKEFGADVVIDMLNMVPVKAIIETCKLLVADDRVPGEYKQGLADAFKDIHALWTAK